MRKVEESNARDRKMEDFIRDGVLYFESQGMKQLEDECYRILAEKSGFPEYELREKTSLHINLDGKIGEVRMSRKFTFTCSVSPESRTALEKLFGEAQVEILPFKNDK